MASCAATQCAAGPGLGCRVPAAEPVQDRVSTRCFGRLVTRRPLWQQLPRGSWPQLLSSSVRVFQVVGLGNAYHGDTLGAMCAVPGSPFNGPRQMPWWALSQTTFVP